MEGNGGIPFFPQTGPEVVDFGIPWPLVIQIAGPGGIQSGVDLVDFISDEFSNFSLLKQN